MSLTSTPRVQIGSQHAGTGLHRRSGRSRNNTSSYTVEIFAMSTDQMDPLILGVVNQQTRQMSSSILFAQLDTIAALFQQHGTPIHVPISSIESTDLAFVGGQFERHR
ncbi:hypothetical protein PV08_06964 [Exophiala spinifera]|uniref:Uncharacterized protein n=1 Tax=Exophiala spinifera TaxID=91928 RepID=A0A0D2B5I6_9EURO|nr:uncharacterized protein PV08_06964 [Exophiala spinifera]KIW14183.1 hypothetical protein PV08_06964 [Exophiala spinifera]